MRAKERKGDKKKRKTERKRKKSRQKWISLQNLLPDYGPSDE